MQFTVTVYYIVTKRFVVPATKTDFQSINQSINELINQSINLSIVHAMETGGFDFPRSLYNVFRYTV